MAGDETRFDQRMMLRREMIDFEISLHLRVVKDVVFMQKHKMHQEESQRLFSEPAPEILQQVKMVRKIM